MDIRAQCKECQGFASANKFKLHHGFKRIVCPNCFSGKTKKKEEEEKKSKKEKINKPKGWDAEDEYLDKMTKIKQEQVKSQFSRIPGTKQIQCKCLGCNYIFKYDPFRKKPNACPYCNRDIPKLTTFNLL